MKKTIFFDFDGVIADSLAAALTVVKMFNSHLTKEEYVKRFDGNVYDFKEEERLATKKMTAANFFKEYEPLLHGSPVFSGMKDMLERTQGDSLSIIVSSTTTPMITEYLRNNDIDRYFAEVMGGDIHRSKIKKIEMAIAKYGMTYADCLFVTDTLGDIKEAHHVGVRTIAVTWGYQPKETLERGNPSIIVDTVSELGYIIESWQTNRLLSL